MVRYNGTSKDTASGAIWLTPRDSSVFPAVLPDAIAVISIMSNDAAIISAAAANSQVLFLLLIPVSDLLIRPVPSLQYSRYFGAQQEILQSTPHK